VLLDEVRDGALGDEDLVFLSDESINEDSGDFMSPQFDEDILRTKPIKRGAT
jgi:hypothetical protein